MGLSVYLKDPTATYNVEELFQANITHDLNRMAAFAGIYSCLWRPEDDGITEARQLIAPLEKALADLKARPVYYLQFDSSNGWDPYVHFVHFVEQYLRACKKYPLAIVVVYR